VCKENDVSQIAFPLHTVIITVIYFWRVAGDSRVLSPFMDIGMFYSTGRLLSEKLSGLSACVKHGLRHIAWIFPLKKCVL